MKKSHAVAATPVKEVRMTLANKITIVRIVLIPVIVIGLLKQRTDWVIALLAFSMATDLLDGLAARLRGERTRLGAFLDPLADKILLTAVYMTITYLGLIETWVFVVIFSRDLLIVIGWGVIYILTSSSTIAPRLLGKATTAVQMATALAFIIDFPEGGRSFLLTATIIFTIASAIDYILVGEKRLGQWG